MQFALTDPAIHNIQAKSLPPYTELKDYNRLANHPLQTYEWGIFNRYLGFEVVQHHDPYFQIIIQRDKKTGLGFGYIPKGSLPDSTYIKAIKHLARQHLCISVTIEPDLTWNYPISSSDSQQIQGLEQMLIDLDCRRTKNHLYPATFTINLKTDTAKLWQSLHTKIRYNCRVAQRHQVSVCSSDKMSDFNQFIEMFSKEIRPRLDYGQRYTPNYFKKFWNVFGGSSMLHILKATRRNQILAIMILLQFKDKFYYPFGASINEQRFTMASTYLTWEAIRYAQAHGGVELDLWGASHSEKVCDPRSESYRGVHRFLQRFGGQLKKASSAWSIIN